MVGEKQMNKINLVLLKTPEGNGLSDKKTQLGKKSSRPFRGFQLRVNFHNICVIKPSIRICKYSYPPLYITQA